MVLRYVVRACVATVAASAASPYCERKLIAPCTLNLPVLTDVCKDAAGAWAVGAATAPAEAEEEVWVLQSATGWARRALDEGMEDEAMGEELLRAFASALGREAAEGGEGGGAAGEAAAGGGALPAVVECHVAVWPYGDMDYQLEGGCAWMEEMRLAMAGDWAYNGRVEGAWLSGRAAAQRVVEAMGQD